MTADQFDALYRLLGGPAQSDAKTAARHILVDGMSIGDAARAEIGDPYGSTLDLI